MKYVLDEVEPAHAERPGQHGAEPAELVAKKVLHQRARFAHGRSSLGGHVLIDRCLHNVGHCGLLAILRTEATCQ